MNTVRGFEGWTLHIHGQTTSTNDLSRNVPAWTAIRADIQTQGRGRYSRAWASGKGGLWLSCSIPAEPPAQRWETLPLATGAAVIEVLQKLGVKGARLRWPNDIMVGPKKLCGLLVERHNAETAVIGMGINVSNQPATDDPMLKGIAVSLVDILPQAPTLDQLTGMILIALREMHSRMMNEGWRYYREFLNALWDASFPVECHLAGDQKIEGFFRGVDAQGNLLLLDSTSQLHTLNPLKVVLFREK